MTYLSSHLTKEGIHVANKHEKMFSFVIKKLWIKTTTIPYSHLIGKKFKSLTSSGKDIPYTASGSINWQKSLWKRVWHHLINSVTQTLWSNSSILKRIPQCIQEHGPECMWQPCSNSPVHNHWHIPRSPSTIKHIRKLWWSHSLSN